MALQPITVNGLGTTPVKSKAYRNYNDSQMQQAIAAVKEGLTPTKASKLYNVPRKTLTDRLQGLHPLSPGRQTVLQHEDEGALEKYVAQMAEWGHPISVRILRALAGEIHERECRKMGTAPRFQTRATGGLVAGRKWWRAFRKRHPTITQRAQDPLSRERAKMSSQDVIDNFFNMYKDILDKNNLHNKPQLVHNCDETGISMEMNRGRVLVPKGVRGVPSRSSGTKDRVTFHLAITADGKTLAPMMIYKKSFPSGAYAQRGPDNCLYAVSDSAFMDKDLFEKWFCEHYVRHLPNERPVLLLLDQCEAHLSVRTIETAMRENIILLGLPPHTSHFLQPLDKTCFSSFKNTIGSIVQGMVFENANFQLSKRNISNITKTAYEKTFSITTIKKGFETTGLYPCNKNAVSKRWVAIGQAAEPVPSTSQEDTPEDKETSCQPCREPGCASCGPKRANPLVGRLIPAELADLLVPPQVEEKRTRVSKAIKTARVFTSEEVLKEQIEKKKKREERLAKKKKDVVSTKNDVKEDTEEERQEQTLGEETATDKKRKGGKERPKTTKKQRKDKENVTSSSNSSVKRSRHRKPPAWLEHYDTGET